ncbi:Ankyrin repeat domain-containing protein [Plasmodiophora brassicae]
MGACSSNQLSTGTGHRQRIGIYLSFGYAGKLEAAIQRGAPIPDDLDGVPVLFWCLQKPIEGMHGANQHARCVRLLIDAGADPNAIHPESRESLLLASIRFGDTQIVAAVIDGGADVNAVSGAANTSPLALADSLGRADIAALLIDAGASPTPDATPVLHEVHAGIKQRARARGPCSIRMVESRKTRRQNMR